MNHVSEILHRQRTFYQSASTRPLSFRKEQLQRLKDCIRENETNILNALKQDMNKPSFEAYASEVGFLYEEIDHTLKHFESWTRPRRVPTPFVHFPASSYIYHEPKGVVLIIGPWNYPFQLLISPVIGAIAAGNCVVLKPSEFAPATSRAISQLATRWDPGFMAVIEGGVETSQALVGQSWDHIFFTGGTAVGRIIMRAAAEHVTPVTLELGGKSPCIVDADIHLEHTARRIVWGKFFNAGQTCVAPDYLLVHTSLKAKLLERMRSCLRTFFGTDPSESPDYARIINNKHFSRLQKMLEGGTIVEGGVCKASERYISPTWIENIAMDHPLMTEEIFGPILPVIEYETLEQAIEIVNQRPKPLALYFFSSNRAHQQKIIREIAFGGGCINDTLIHLSNPNLPFGGIGTSGIGAYHGKFSFDTFSHQKAITHRSFLLDSKLRYPPYFQKIKWLRFLFR